MKEELIALIILYALIAVGALICTWAAFGALDGEIRWQELRRKIRKEYSNDIEKFKSEVKK